MCGWHYWLWLVVDSGVVHSEGFHSDKLTIRTSKKRRVCGSHVGLGATIPWCGWSGFRGWARICLQQSASLGWERESPFNWMTSLFLHYHYFPGHSRYMETVHQEVHPIPPRRTHTNTNPRERKRSYDSPGQRLPLQMAHSHVQQAN